MKALILAAGLGTRLAPITDEIPKSLVSVNGTPILIKQLRNLADNKIDDITVVSGYKADVLEGAVHEEFPSVKIIQSPNYDTTNNMYSAWLGRENLLGDPFLMMNADVFFDSSVISSLLHIDSPNAIVCEQGRYIEESMKVTVEGNRITSISKSVPIGLAYGTSIDVYKFSSLGGSAFFDKCAEYIERRNEKNLWSEVALNDILSVVDFCPCQLEGRWLEIDNHDDLSAAEQLFRV